MNELFAKIEKMHSYSEDAIAKLKLELESAKMVLAYQREDVARLGLIKYADMTQAIADVNKAIVAQTEHIEYLEHLIMERARESANYKAILTDLSPLAEEFRALKISRVVEVIHA